MFPTNSELIVIYFETIADGYFGWPEEAPFDAIMVTAATPSIPPPLLEQLAAGGRLIAPIDDTMGQTLTLVTKDRDGHIQTDTVLPVVFVPLTGNH